MCPCAHSIYIYIYIYIYTHTHITFLSLLALRLACFLDPRRAAGEPESIFAIHSSPGGHTSFSSFDGNPAVSDQRDSPAAYPLLSALVCFSVEMPPRPVSQMSLPVPRAVSRVLSRWRLRAGARAAGIFKERLRRAQAGHGHEILSRFPAWISDAEWRA